MLWPDKVSPPKGLPEKDFIGRWGSFYLIAIYNGENHRFLSPPQYKLNIL